LKYLHNGHLGAINISMASAALIVALTEAAAPIAAIGGIASGIRYLTSYGGIRRLHQYRNIPLVKGL
jgi:choline-glycine betaine transporter